MNKSTWKFLLVMICITSSSFTHLHSQIKDKIYGTAGDFKAFQKRTLVVELQEEDAKTIEKLSKKKKGDDLEKYKRFITDYNAFIKEVVDKYWTLNEKKEYKTASEVKELRDAKNNKYVIMSYYELSDKGGDVATRSGLEVPALLYSRAEKEPGKQPDYQIYLPSSYTRENSEYMKYDFAFAVQAMQANIQYIIKTSKPINFEDWAKVISETNCPKLKSKTLLVDKAKMKEKATVSDIKSVYEGEFKITTADDLDKSYTSQTKGDAVLFLIPFGLMKTSGSVVSSARLVYLRVAADCETGEILFIFEPGAIGTFLDDTIRENDFKKMTNCKFK